MRVDSSESEVRQDGMLPADEKSMLFAFVFPEVKTNTKENKPQGLTVHYCIRCCIKETQNPFSLMRYCKPLYKKRKEFLCLKTKIIISRSSLR